MAYRTYYTLSIYTDKGEDFEYEIIDALRSSYNDAFDAFDDSGQPETDATWNNMDNDLKEFSKRYPDIKISIYGEGETNTDLWISWFQDGKMQHCPANITFDEFDFEKLQ